MKTPKTFKISGRAKGQAAASIMVSFAAACLLAGCGAQTASPASVENGSQLIESSDAADAREKGESSLMTYEEAVSGLDVEYSDRESDARWESRSDLVRVDLQAFESGDGAVLENGVLTISQAGTYDISGSCSQIVVDADDADKVQIVLDGAAIENKEGNAIYGKNADKIFITLAEGSENTVSDGASYGLETENGDDVNAAIFATCDLSLNGNGKLTVNGNKQHAVYSKDDLTIVGGTYAIESEEDAIRGKDSVKIKDGAFEISSGGDAIKSSEDGSDDKGYVIIDGGDFTIEAGDDAVHAETVLAINGGTIDIGACSEGYEGEKVFINGGNSDIDSSDDGINAVARGESSEPAMGGGANGGFGFFWDSDASSESETVPADEASEQDADGATGQTVGDGQARMRGEAPSGSIDDNVIAPPDAIEQNVMEPPENLDGKGSVAPGEFNGMMAPLEGFDGNESQPDGMPGNGDFNPSDMPGSMFEGADNLFVSINGGTLTIHARGDGIDSNGNFEITAGEVYIYGPGNSDNSALDLGGEGYANGGILVGVGSDMMSCGFSKGSQASIFSSTDNCSGTITVKDSSGNVLAAIDDVESCQSIVATTPDMVEDDLIGVSSTSGMEMTVRASKEHDTEQMGFGKQRGDGGRGSFWFGESEGEGSEGDDGNLQSDDRRHPSGGESDGSEEADAGRQRNGSRSFSDGQSEAAEEGTESDGSDDSRNRNSNGAKPGSSEQDSEAIVA